MVAWIKKDLRRRGSGGGFCLTVKTMSALGSVVGWMVCALPSEDVAKIVVCF